MPSTTARASKPNAALAHPFNERVREAKHTQFHCGNIYDDASLFYALDNGTSIYTNASLALPFNETEREANHTQ